MPTHAHNIAATDVNTQIRLLIQNLISIRDTTGEFLLPLPDGRIIDTKGWSTGWEWTHGIGLYGIWNYHALTGDASLLTTIESWFAARFAEGGTTKNINTMAVFLTLAHVYETTHNATYLPWLDAWAEWAMYDLPRTRFGGMQHATYLDPNTQQLWDDTLMMTVLPLAKIGKLLNRPHYIEEAKRQFLVHIKYLLDTKTGLFFHGWQFNIDPETGAAPAVGGEVGHNFASALWARGNSWLTIAIPEILELLDLPATDPIRTHLLDTLTAQVDALRQLQDPATGLFRTLLTDPTSYPESSATAGFAFGILKAVRKRYIPACYEAVGVKAVKGVLANISPEGELLGVSFGTGMGDTLEFYRGIRRTSMPYGQAMAIMALGEFLRRFI